MQVRLWSGENVSTELFEVANGIEWQLLVEGSKTALRRTGKMLLRQHPTPRLVMGTHGDSFVPFVLKSIEKQHLGDVTEEDAREEGMANLDAYKEHWIRVLGHTHFPVHERVWVYRLERFDPSCPSKDTWDALVRLSMKLYPTDLG